VSAGGLAESDDMLSQRVRARGRRQASANVPATGRRRGQQQGQTLIAFSLCMALFLSAMLAMVADLSVMYTMSTRAKTAALVGAISGSNDIDRAQLYNGRVVLGATAPGTCQSRAQDVLRGAGTVNCVASGARMTVTVSVTVKLPIDVFGIHPVVHGSQTACAVQGALTPLAGAC
jgi:Flp pilus assembly protein TadG